jgi:hypothetical protein
MLLLVAGEPAMQDSRKIVLRVAPDALSRVKHARFSLYPDGRSNKREPRQKIGDGKIAVSIDSNDRTNPQPQSP